MEKFDYFREKTGKNLNYNHYSGKLTPGCERSVIKIPPKNVYRSKRLSSLFYLQNSDCFAFQQFVKREFTICCDWLSECCYVDVCLNTIVIRKTVYIMKQGKWDLILESRTFCLIVFDKQKIEILIQLRNLASDIFLTIPKHED